MSDEPKISLNLVQQEAVEHPIDAPLKVIAGAGTGKTMVLTHRFVHILKEHPDISPHNILALTFTNKAAAEMKERIIALARQEGIIGRDAASPPQLWVGTFHSFCGRILRENAFEAGLDPDFTVLGEADARQIYHHIVDDFVSLRLDTGQFKPDECQYVRFENPRFLYSDLLIFISKLKDQLVSPSEFREIAHQGNKTYYAKLDSLFTDALASSDIPAVTKKALKRRQEENIPYEYNYEAEMIEIVYHIYSAYQKYLAENDILDFGDLIFKAYTLMNGNELIRQRYRQRFKYILVDEFQDTNEAQFRLLRLIAHDEKLSNVTVVGDDKQAIYGWRNARVENVDDFEADEWGGQSLNVSKNYRSYGEILSVAHFSIVQDEKFGEKSDDIRLEPESRGMANKPIVMLYEAGTREREASFIAQEIANLLKIGAEPDSIAILMRSLRAVKIYEDALRALQIPYRTSGGTGFYDRQEIKDILAYLTVIDNPFETTALIRILKRPPVGLDDLSLYRLRRERNDQLFDALSHAGKLLEDREAVRRIEGFIQLIEEMWEIAGEGGIFYLVSRLLERSGYLKYIYGKAADERQRSLGNIRKLLRIASEFERKNIFRDLGDFVQYVRFSMDQLVVEAEAGSVSGRKAVQIMTVHQAKGLEFDTVFVINTRKQSFPTNPRHPMFAMNPEDGLIINIERNKEKFLKFNPYDLKKNSYNDEYGIADYYNNFRKEHLSEERRIWYVAITRAKQLLYLSWPASMDKGSGRGGEADFFQEIYDQFAEAGTICQFRSFREESEYSEAELPLWKGRDKPAFASVEEAKAYGRQLQAFLRKNLEQKT